VSKQDSTLESQRKGLEEAARLAASSADGAQRLREAADGADERLRESLGAQCRALAGQEGNVVAQRQQLKAVWAAKRDGWKGLADTVGRGSLQVREIVGAVRERIGGLFDGSPVALEGEAALDDLQTALEGHSATQEALLATLRNSTCELQVLRVSLMVSLLLYVHINGRIPRCGRLSSLRSEQSCRYRLRSSRGIAIRPAP
jgi:hypothetical protein